MADLLAFLALVAAVAVLTGVAVFAGALLVNVAGRYATQTGAALPSHYTGALTTASSRRAPGHCQECGANNDPASTVCGECAARLPDTGRRHHGRTETPNAHLKD